MMDFLSWLEQLPFSMWVLQSGSVWAYPSILTLHTIGMTVVAGLAGLIDMRLIGVSPTTPIKPLEKLYPVIWWGFAVNAVTGTILLVADATTKLTNPDFYIKMAFIAVGVVLLKVMRRRIFQSPELDVTPLPSSAKGLAWVSLVCWMAAITSGRLLAYLGPVSGGVKGLVNK
jgi:hypothetical protein